jgi:hypothetical protein
MSRDDLSATLLLEIAFRAEEARARPEPAAWRTWELDRWRADIELGPKYSPSWLGSHAATEAGRVRALRCLHKLAGAGLVDLVKSEGGRLERVQLTPAGAAAVDEMQKAEPAGVIGDDDLAPIMVDTNPDPEKLQVAQPLAER